MPSNSPTGFETYIYDHKQFPGSDEDYRQHLGKLHDPKRLPAPVNDNQTGPFIMVEPSHSSQSNDVFILFRGLHAAVLDRYTAEQLRDALIKVCEKPMVEG